MNKRLIVLFSAVLALCAHAGVAGKFFAYRSFWPETEAMKQFADIGVNLYAVMPSNSFNSLGEPYCKFPPFWVWDETYLWENVDAQFDVVLKANPNARFICMVDINSPLWLVRRLDKKYGFGGDSYQHISNALCIPEWKNITKKMLRAYVLHMEEKYGDRIVSYIVAGGGTSEWYCNSQGYANVPKRNAWYRWLNKNGFPKWEVPSRERMDSPAIDGNYFDPKTQRAEAEYSRFLEELISDGVDEFLGEVKKIVGDKKQVGAFCGFIPLRLYGKLDNSRTFASKSVDFVGSPGGYFNRDIGLGGGISSPRKSVDLYGKHWFQEIDHRTHTYNGKLSPYVQIGGIHASGAKNQAETNAILKREFSLAAVMGNSLWCFDMWGGIFKTPETMELVGKSYEIWKKYKDAPLDYRAEIVMVIDPDSAFYMKNPLKIERMIKALYSCGAPFDYILFDDIENLDFSKYKMAVFPWGYSITPEKRKILENRVMNSGRTVVFMDAAGMSDGARADPANVEKLTGFKYKTKGVSEKDMGGWKSVYGGSITDFDKNSIMRLAREAGVHIYTDEPLPVYSNGKLVAVHVKEGGLKKVHLPKKAGIVKELYSGKTVAENADSFEYDFASPDTALFEISD